MDGWGWQELEPWLIARVALPVGPLFCVIKGRTRGRPWTASGRHGDHPGARGRTSNADVHAPRAPSVAGRRRRQPDISWHAEAQARQGGAGRDRVPFVTPSDCGGHRTAAHYGCAASNAAICTSSRMMNAPAATTQS
jgi:hypothetical protein